MAGLYIKTHCIEGIVSSAFLDVFVYKKRALAFTGFGNVVFRNIMHPRRVVSSAFLDGVLSNNKCALAFTGCGRLAYENIVHRRLRFRFIYGCDTCLQ